MKYLKYFEGQTINIKLIKINKTNYKILDNKIQIGVVELIFDEADEDNYPLEGSYINIVGLQIYPEYRGNGYANICIEKIIELARLKKINNVVLDAEKSNTVANNLYQKYFKKYKADNDYNHYFLKIK